MRAVHVCTDVTALDLTPELLELARAKPGADAIRFDHGDAQALPYADGSFDVVASNFGVIFAADRDAGARELAVDALVGDHEGAGAQAGERDQRLHGVLVGQTGAGGAGVGDLQAGNKY